MFPDVGFSEMALIGILALLVVGPKDLPLLMRKLGRFMNKIRSMAAEFRASFDDLARQAELDELRKEVEAMRNNDVVRGFEADLKKPVDLPPDLRARKDAIIAARASEEADATTAVVAPFDELAPAPGPEMVASAKPKAAPRKRISKKAAAKPDQAEASS